MLTEEERKFLSQVHLDVEVDEEDEIKADSIETSKMKERRVKIVLTDYTDYRCNF